MNLRAKNAVWIDTLASGRGALWIVFALVTYLWWPSLWHDKLVIYGDSGLHGLPSLWLLGDSLAGKESLLWSSRVYGGHPMFAEGQGGYANPLTLFSVWCFGPIYALGFIHWVNMLIGATGVFTACRILGISRWSATFAAIAVAFSGIWISNQQNLPISSTISWVPWLIAATESWLRQPSPARAALLAIPAALLVFSGYPQLTHGVTLYVLASLSVQFFQQEARGLVVKYWRKLLVTGLLALVLAIGLSAIQFLPLLELAEQSHRSQGTAIIFGGWIPYKNILKGVLFFYFGTDQDGENAFNLANITACGLAFLLIFFRAPIRIVGQLLGLLLLFNLGMGATSPFFQFVYIHNLIPGLHYFRTMSEYFSVAVIGIAIVSAYVLDTLSFPGLVALHGVFRRRLWLFRVLAALLGGGLMALCYQLYVPTYGRLILLAPALMVPGYFLLHLSGRRNLFPLIAVLLLSIDVLTLRIHAFDFYDREIVAQPREIRTISSEFDVQDFHVMDASLAGLMVFLAPTDASVGLAYRRIHRTLSPFTSALQWKIPSINGVLALQLARRDLLIPVLDEEVSESVPARAGLRMIDILGIRYISRDATLPAIGLSLFAHDQAQSIFIYRNNYAKPRFQVYWNAEVVDTPEQALAGLKVAQSEKLFIERHRGEHLALPVACTDCAVNKPAIEVIEAQAMRYRMNVNMQREGWLFLADANYPGWEAAVNGKAQPVYSAQVLGKAVRLQAGRNEVTIRYVPWSFYIGAAVSAMTLLTIVVILARNRRKATPEC